MLQQSIKKAPILGVEYLGATSRESHPGVVRFKPLYSTTVSDITLRYPNRRVPGLKLSPRVIFQMPTPGIQIIWDNSIPLTLHSGSIFPNAIDPVVHNGTFYAAGHDVIITRQGEGSP